jgi:hypothetical protein
MLKFPFLEEVDFCETKRRVAINNNNFYIKIIKSIRAGFSPLLL